MDAVIETDGLTKIWGEVTAVSDLSLRVMAEECYAFLGRNGSGKSTTARMLLDFIRPTRGSARVLGGSGRDPAIRARVGYLPGDLNLPRAMTGAAAIEYFGALQGGGHEAEAASLVERFGLDPSRPVRELSTGNRRKVGLVLAFMSRPELLILDEPTSGIDPKSPLGYLWIGLYANVYPWMLMAFGVVLGVAAIAGDEDTGGLEYLLAWPATRSTVTLARFASMLTILALVAAASGLSLVICLPLFDLTEPVKTTAA